MARATAAQDVERRAVSDLASFAWSFYAQVRGSETNFVYSPYSIVAASAMLSAGAAGRTLTQMQAALRFSGVGAPLHGAQSALALLLHSRNRNHAGDPERKTQVLRISNDLWMATESPPKPAFLDTLERHYGSGVHLVSFHEDPERSRGAINQKVCRDTEGLIPELLPRGSIKPDNKLVLTNALYFKAGWESPFPKRLTEPRPFVKLSGETTQVATMSRVLQGHYADGHGYLAVALPYRGHELELVLLVPDAGSFARFVASLRVAQIGAITSKLRPERLALAMPKFQLQTTLPLKAELMRAGMVDAFTRAALFPLLGDGVYVSEAHHQARLILDEEGTEAAAATAFGARTLSGRREPTPIEVKIDRPFVFFIRDTSGAVLFVGHIGDPR